jgi:hypothetical protein
MTGVEEANGSAEAGRIRPQFKSSLENLSNASGVADKWRETVV